MNSARTQLQPQLSPRTTLPAFGGIGERQMKKVKRKSTKRAHFGQIRRRISLKRFDAGSPVSAEPNSNCRLVIGYVNCRRWIRGRGVDQEFQVTRESCFLRCSHSEPVRIRGVMSMRRGVSLNTSTAVQARPSRVCMPRRFSRSAMRVKERS
jgi:hypothetical protein